MPRRLLNRLPHLIVTIQIKNIRHQVQCILVILHFGIQAREVKAIRQVILINFAKVLITPRGNKLKKKMLAKVQEISLETIHEPCGETWVSSSQCSAESAAAWSQAGGNIDVAINHTPQNCLETILLAVESPSMAV